MRNLVIIAGGLALACSSHVSTHRDALATAVTTFFHADEVAGPVLFTDAVGQVIEERRYDPFGVPIDARVLHGASYDVGPPDFVARDFNALNKRTDPATGWSDHGARWLAPETARWLATDPAIEGPSAKTMLAPWKLHPYAYVHQNPIAYWDPDGREDFRKEARELRAQYAHDAQVRRDNATARIGGAVPGRTAPPAQSSSPDDVFAALEWNNRLSQTGAAALNPILAISGKLDDLQKEAFQATARFARETGSNVAHNNYVDAFRHAYFSYRFADSENAFKAKRWTDAHEVSVPNAVSETAMDLWNNAVGRQLAEDHPDGDAYAVVRDAYQKGLLMTSPLGTTPGPTVPKYEGYDHKSK